MLRFPGTQQHRAAEQEPQLDCVQEGKRLLPGLRWEESEGFLSPQCVFFLSALEKFRKSCEGTLKRGGRGTYDRGRGQGAGARLPGPFPSPRCFFARLHPWSLEFLWKNSAFGPAAAPEPGEGSSSPGCRSASRAGTRLQPVKRSEKAEKEKQCV